MLHRIGQTMEMHEEVLPGAFLSDIIQTYLRLRPGDDSAHL